MAMENSAVQNTRDLFVKAADVTWSPELETPSEIDVVSLRHRGVDRLILKFGSSPKPKGMFGNLLSLGKAKNLASCQSTVSVTDEDLCLEQNGRKTTVLLSDIQAIEITEASRNQVASLRVETCRAILRCGNGLDVASLKWLRDKLILEAAGLVWKPIFNVGRRTTLKTVSQDFDTYMKWPTGSHPIFEFFFEKAPKKASELVSAIGSKDTEVARDRADWLKSACAVVGATYLSGLCQRIEVNADNQEFDGILALVQNFETEFNLVLTHLCKLSDRPLDDSDLLEESAGDVEVATASKAAKILLVEDSIVNQELASSLLSLAGHKTTIASGGLEALDLLDDDSFDLILMDCQMPGLDGIETTKKIRENEKLRMSGRTPIVALTANALKDDKKRCMDANMDDYLSKPYAPAELMSVVERWISPPEKAELATA